MKAVLSSLLVIVFLIALALALGWLAASCFNYVFVPQGAQPMSFMQGLALIILAQVVIPGGLKVKISREKHDPFEQLLEQADKNARKGNA